MDRKASCLKRSEKQWRRSITGFTNNGLPYSTVVLSVGVGAVLAGWLAWRRYLSSKKIMWEDVGEVSELLIYPLKSAKAIRKSRAQATIYGLASGSLEDRAFMVISTQGQFITCRQAGALATIVTQMEGHTLTLRAKGFHDLKVDLDEDLKGQPILEARLRGTPVSGVDCGDNAAEWLTSVLYKGEKKVRLIYKGDVLRDRKAASSAPKYFDFKNYQKGDKLFYADEGSYMIASQSSLEDLNNRLTESHHDNVTIENFRPNLVVRGSRPYDEDDWAVVRVGEVIFRRLKPCERCILVTVDPISGERHPQMEPLTTMKKYRLLKDPPELAKRWSNSPIFGVTMGIDTTGTISVGDRVMVARASLHPDLKGF